MPSDLSPTTFRRPLEKYGFCGELAAHTGWHLAADERRAGQSVQPGCADHPCEVYPSDSTLIPHLCRKPSTSETIENDDYYTITPNSSYTHQTAFAAETAPTLTKQLSQQKPFTPISLYTRNPLQLIHSHQTAFAPEAILHRTAFTPETFCARKRLYLKTLTTEAFYT